MKIRPSSDCSSLVYLGENIDLETHGHVVRLLRALEAHPPAWLRNVQPGYCSLLVTFNALEIAHADVESELLGMDLAAESAPATEPRTIEIPVCYGGEMGPDLLDVAAAKSMKPHQVVEMHSAQEYHAYFVGFAPGFAYLGDVPEALAMPRLPTPRRAVPAGSVAIAGRQTGVYPFATPGGWRILGRTPLAIFRADREPMSLITLGDRVRFKPITQDAFAKPERA
jgi:KipI family sensor histidine kinase inhibitor